VVGMCPHPVLVFYRTQHITGYATLHETQGAWTGRPSTVCPATRGWPGVVCVMADSIFVAHRPAAGGYQISGAQVDTPAPTMV
jgi:hypothetical protein